MMMAVKLTALFFLVAAFDVELIDSSRLDYTYVPSIHAWYKYHENEATWAAARDTCRREGAVLFHPDDDNELSQVKVGLSVSTWSIHSGFSYFMNTGDYETVDGRPLGQVFNKWELKYPEWGSSQGWRCGGLDVLSLELVVWDCDYDRPFICKAAAADPVTASEDAKIAIANLTAKVADLEKELANRTAVLEAVEREAQAMKINDGIQIAALKVLTANQTAALLGLERDVETIKLYVATQQKHLTYGNGLEVIAEAVTNQAANLTTAMERQTATIRLQAANRIAASDRLMTNMVTAMQQLTAVIGQQVQSQTALMERLILAMEKNASQEEYSQLDVRSEQ